MSNSLFVLGTLFIALGHPSKEPLPSQDVWISDPKVLEGEVLAGSILLRPKTLGVTHVSGLDKKSPTSQLKRVQVVSYENFQALQRCPKSTLVPTATGLQTTSLQENDLKKLFECGFEELEFSKNSYGRILHLLEQTETKLLATGSTFKQAMWKDGKRVVQVSRDANLARFKEKMGYLAAFYKFEKNQNVQPGRTLIFEIVLFEFSTHRARALGLSWPQSLKFFALDGSLNVLQQDGSKGLSIGADFGESEGVGRILARPQIRTLPGEKATFHSGGEIPIKTRSLTQISTTWKPYGLLVDIEPSAQTQIGDDEISLKFKVELSEPDGATSVDGTPGMISRKLESRFDIRTGETTVLTTMIQSRNLKSLNGLPGLSQIPGLSPIFSKHRGYSHDTELWFAIKGHWEGTH